MSMLWHNVLGMAGAEGGAGPEPVTETVSVVEEAKVQRSRATLQEASVAVGEENVETMVMVTAGEYCRLVCSNELAYT